MPTWISEKGPLPGYIVGMLFRAGMLVLMFRNARFVLADLRLKTTLVAGVFELCAALLGRAPHAAYLSALPKRANPQSGVVGNSPRHFGS
jgi:hypothetical protein